MDSEAIIARVAQAKTLCDLPQLIQDLECIDPSLLFDTLFPIATKRQGSENRPVAFSAYVIVMSKTRCGTRWTKKLTFD